MSVIIIPRRHYTQPQARRYVDWDCALVQAGKIFAVITPAGGIQTPDGAAEPLLTLNNGILIPYANGLAFGSGGGSSDGFRTTKNFDELSGLTAMSAYIEGDIASNAVAPIGRWGASYNWGGFVTAINSGQFSWIVAESSSLDYWRGRRTATWVPGFSRLGMSWVGGGDITPYVDGVKSVGGLWFGGSAASIQAVSAPLFVARHGDDGTSGGASIGIAVFGAAAWEDSLHNEIADAPYQIFRADPIRIYSLPSGPISISWSSLTASNITQTGATLTLGGIVR